MAQTPSSEADAIIRKCVHCGSVSRPVRPISCWATSSIVRAGDPAHQRGARRQRGLREDAAASGSMLSVVPAKRPVHRECSTRRLLTSGGEHVEARSAAVAVVNLIRRVLRVV